MKLHNARSPNGLRPAHLMKAERVTPMQCKQCSKQTTNKLAQMKRANVEHSNACQTSWNSTLQCTRALKWLTPRKMLSNDAIKSENHQQSGFNTQTKVTTEIDEIKHGVNKVDVDDRFKSSSEWTSLKAKWFPPRNQNQNWWSPKAKISLKPKIFNLEIWS